MGLIVSLLWNGYPNGINPSPLGYALLGWKETPKVFSEVGGMAFYKIRNFGRNWWGSVVDICHDYPHVFEHFMEPGFQIGQFWWLSRYSYDGEYYKKISGEYVNGHYAAAAAFFWVHILHWLWKWTIKGLILLVVLVLRTAFVLVFVFGGLLLYLLLIVGYLLSCGILVLGGFWIVNLVLALVLGLLSYACAPFLCLGCLCERDEKQNGQNGQEASSQGN
jgi:hypothetical protein